MTVVVVAGCLYLYPGVYWRLSLALTPIHCSLTSLYNIILEFRMAEPEVRVRAPPPGDWIEIEEAF